MIKHRIIGKRKLLALVLVIVSLAIVVMIFFLVKKPGTETIAKQGKTTTTEENGVKVTTSAESTKNSSSPTTSSSNNLADITPIAPFGTFVSNHRPNLDGKSSSNQMNSVCQTTPGVTCEIRFTSNGQIKILGPSKVGSDGYVSWDWKLQDIGLREGSWGIEAIAKNGDKTTATKDPMPLEVGL